MPEVLLSQRKKMPKHRSHLSPVHTGDKVDCCRNRRQIATKSTVYLFKDFTVHIEHGRKNGNSKWMWTDSTVRDRPIRSTLSPIQSTVARMSNVLSTLSPVCTGLKIMHVPHCKSCLYNHVLVRWHACTQTHIQRQTDTWRTIPVFAITTGNNNN